MKRYSRNSPPPEEMRCSRIKRDGQQCAKLRAVGSKWCRLHGANARKGASHPNFKTGRYAKYFAGGEFSQILADRYQESFDDPELMSLKDEMALVESRLKLLVERVSSEDASVHTWKQLLKLWRALQRDLLGDDEDARRKAHERFAAALSGYIERESMWEEIGEWSERKSRLIDAIRKYEVDAGKVMTREQAQMLFAVIAAVIQQRTREILQLVAPAATTQFLTAIGHDFKLLEDGKNPLK